MSQGSLNPKISFLGQKMWPVARTWTHTQTDRLTDRHSDYWGHPFRVSGFFPSTYHQGSYQWVMAHTCDDETVSKWKGVIKHFWSINSKKLFSKLSYPMFYVCTIVKYTCLISFTLQLYYSNQDQIAQLKSKMSANAKECEERNKILKEVRYYDGLCRIIYIEYYTCIGWSP